MSRHHSPPPTLETVRPSWLAKPEQGIYTFSNGTEWECWAEPNCLSCRWWNPDEAGASCAFEGAALLGMVTPELAHLFGWIRDDEAAEKYGERSAWSAPDECAFFRERPDENDRPEPPPTDPRQLVLIADPTEDIASITVPAPEHTEAVA